MGPMIASGWCRNGSAVLRASCVTILISSAIVVAMPAQPQSATQPATAPSTRPARPRATTGAVEPAVTKDMIERDITRGVHFILSVQEGDDKAEWPYEGVYRVDGRIPIGYRIGGTGICAMALLKAPGYKDDSRRQDAMVRAVKFIIEGSS